MRVIQIAEKCNEHLQCSVEDSILFFFSAAARMVDEIPKSPPSTSPWKVSTTAEDLAQ